MIEALLTPATGTTYTVILVLLICHQWVGDWINRHINICESGLQQLRVGSSSISILLLLIAIFYHDESYLSTMRCLVSLCGLYTLYTVSFVQLHHSSTSHLRALLGLVSSSSLIVINRPLAPLDIQPREHLWTSLTSIALIIIWLLATRPILRSSQ